MDKRIISRDDDFKKINSFSSRAIGVYNSEMLMTKVKFEQSTDDYGFHQHYHSQVTYVLEGSFLFVIDGKEYQVSKGDSLLIESNLEHGCIPLSLPGLLLDVFCPIREDFFEN